MIAQVEAIVVEVLLVKEMVAEVVAMMYWLKARVLYLVKEMFIASIRTKCNKIFKRTANAVLGNCKV